MSDGRVPGDAIHAAAVAMAQVETGADGTTPNDIDFLLARIALEASAPIILKDMRPMTMVEIAARDRPESMEKAREQVRAERRDSQAEMIRKAQELAWDRGMADMASLMNAGAGFEMGNPYRPTS